MNDFDKYIPHLLEFRKRSLKCLMAYGLLLLPLIIWQSELYTLIAQPILKSLPKGGMLIATTVIAPFTAPLKLAFFVSLVLIIPYVLYHVWAFAAPGLYPRERRTVFPVLFMSTGLFYIGMLFAHLIVCPLALGFFMHIAPKGVTVMTDIDHYLDFILVLYFAFGISFQVPIVTFLLIRANVVTLETLKKHRPYIIVAAFMIGMLLTPPDVVSQILLAIPLLGLFEGGILLAKWLPAKSP